MASVGLFGIQAEFSVLLCDSEAKFGLGNIQ